MYLFFSPSVVVKVILYASKYVASYTKNVYKKARRS